MPPADPSAERPGPVILGIESSCDDTAAAVWDGRRIRASRRAGQDVHAAFGGVVPEHASRAHQRHIVPLVDATLREAGLAPGDLDAVAVTRGPGLLGSLLVGAGFAKGLALGWGLPLVGVHHMKAHVLAHFIEPPFPPFPFLCLTVSGGHTQLVRVDGPLAMTVLGRTLDDAAGEAFDKSAKLLGLPYPGGPVVDRLAADGDPARFAFARPDIPGLDFSFSGLKTSVRYFLDRAERREPGFAERHRADLCAAVQDAIVAILLDKLGRAVEATGLTHVALAGGVSANRGLRSALAALAGERGWTAYVPDPAWCTDNGAMIARAGAFLFAEGVRHGSDLTAEARLPWDAA